MRNEVEVIGAEERFASYVCAMVCTWRSEDCRVGGCFCAWAIVDLGEQNRNVRYVGPCQGLLDVSVNGDTKRVPVCQMLNYCLNNNYKRINPAT